MAPLDRNLRKDLESAVRKARRAAEPGARQSLELLAVPHHEPWGTLAPAQRALRNRLRAHGRQLGDRRDDRDGTQAIDRLAAECAYEHWHRMLFARFLAENDLLIEPESAMPLSLEECRELALERGTDWLALASAFAERMLPQIFRAGDPVLEVSLPPETRQELEEILKALPRAVFAADDSLGWVYQFWQAEQKDAVNKSEKKIGADELPAVTQLFTEDYMVLFLLHNTLGAWWAGKALAGHPDLAATAATEDELRAACAVGGIEWTYLRFMREGEAPWRPAAGAFDGWPRAARDLTLLDPCMGSGHFLVFALPILMAFRMAEEGLSPTDALRAVLEDNLFGLEIDPRCTQIAAFNLALAAWRLGGYQALPALNLACSGLGINAREEDWLALAGGETKAREAMKRLYTLFEQAPTLGSLIDPRRIGGDLFVAEFEQVQPLLERALAVERSDEAASEMAVTAQGVLAAARILAGRFALVATNVPYLGRRKQSDALKKFCERVHPEAKADLATCFLERGLEFCREGGAVALVTPQNWLTLGTYTSLRESLLQRDAWNCAAFLGSNAFELMNWWAATTALVVLSAAAPASGWAFAGFDTSGAKDPDQKASHLAGAGSHQYEGLTTAEHDGFSSTAIQGPVLVVQSRQLSNADARIVIEANAQHSLLARYAEAFHGLTTGDTERLQHCMWERPTCDTRWVFFCSSFGATVPFAGRSHALLWNGGAGALLEIPGARRDGQAAWGRSGVLIRPMRHLPATLYTGEAFDINTAVLIPRNTSDLAALWCFVSSHDYREAVRTIDRKVNVTSATLAKVGVDFDHWQKVAAEKYPDGLPKSRSDDPTQWLFNGHPKGSEAPLQVAAARLLGYRWPRQTGSEFPDCPALGPDGLDRHAEEDGIVCLAPLRGEASAADRLRALLADAFGSAWSAAKQNELLAAVGFDGRSLDDWLREGFFEQHCALFHQRPFVWHVWDGLKNGFGALVNYHKLAAPDGEGRRTLEKLVFTYLGDWIDRQRADQKVGVEGADARVAAAEHLKRELERILAGEPPYDLFVRWKPLHEQPIGWEPALDDGVRLNIRPFVQAKPLSARGKNACILRVTPKIRWDKDRGKEPARPKRDFPWFWGWAGQAVDFAGGKEFDGNRWNALHYTRGVKLAARERAKGGTKG